MSGLTGTFSSRLPPDRGLVILIKRFGTSSSSEYASSREFSKSLSRSWSRSASDGDCGAVSKGADSIDDRDEDLVNAETLALAIVIGPVGICNADDLPRRTDWDLLGGPV